jgi:hypothetical protein
MIVEVTQYMRPDGRKVKMLTPIHDSFQAPYDVIKMRGWRIAAEVLTDGMVSVAVEDDEQDLANEIVENGPEIPRAIERVLAEALALIQKLRISSHGRNQRYIRNSTQGDRR